MARASGCPARRDSQGETREADGIDLQPLAGAELVATEEDARGRDGHCECPM